MNSLEPTMEFAGCVSSIIGLCRSLHEVFKNYYKYFGTSERNIQQLNNLMRKLDACKKDIEHELDRLWHQKGAKPTKICDAWFSLVDKVETEASSFMDENVSDRPTIGCCVICSEINLGKLVEEKIRDIQELLESAPRGEDSIATVVNKRGDILAATPMMELETHRQILMEIWGSLLDENAGRIGVWGMGGAGKTTIMLEINNRLVTISSPFNCVIWVDASNDLKKVQQDIAWKLGFTFEENDDGRGRASKLLEAFNRRKTFALILDDVWQSFPIEEVGIPVPTVENGCKLVIITRNLAVCKAMETDKDIKVKRLPYDEALNLFKDKVGKLVLSDPYMQRIAKEVVAYCGGLPLAIVTVGHALRNTTDRREWENASDYLGSSNKDGDIHHEIYLSVELSYSNLKDHMRRSCFLFCALYPKGHLIDESELINYWMWEGLLGDLSMPVMKRKGQMIVDELSSACLLQSKSENGVRYVKLHDLIRDMAIKVMHHRCFVKAGRERKISPPPEEWKEDMQWASLMRNDMKSIGFSPVCPELTSLLLQYNSFKENISGDFFDNMQGLKVLDLSYTGIRCVPFSLSNLENLCALILSHCWNLDEVPSLARLTKLKYLDFSFSRLLTELPEGMEQLINLRHLNLSFTSVQNLKTGVISKYTLLEELLIMGSPMTGASSEDTKYCSYPVRVEEVVACPKLSLVHMQLLGIVAYQKIVRCLEFSQLKEFKFLVGFQLRDGIPDLFEETSLAIDMRDEADNLSEAEITELIPRNVMELLIRNSHVIKRLSLHLLGALCLKSCDIRSCRRIECILKSEENNLSQLERMNLCYLHDLRMICGKVVKPGTLMNLKSIHVERCDSLKCLFPRQLMLELESLQEITIVRCGAMEEIIEGERNTNAEDSSHAAKVILPKLQRLKLLCLPNLKCIYNGDIHCESLCTIEVFDCKALKKLPLGLFRIEAGQQMSPSATPLEQISCETEWWESLQWDQPQDKHLLQPYFVVHPGSRDRFAPSSSHTA